MNTIHLKAPSGNLSASARSTQTRLQFLLDDGDAHFFDGHPTETERIRFYFKGERIDGDTSKYVVVTRQADGTLIRRFVSDCGDA